MKKRILAAWMSLAVCFALLSNLSGAVLAAGYAGAGGKVEQGSISLLSNGSGKSVLKTADKEAAAGETISVPVTIQGTAGVSAFALQITYDPSVLVLESISQGALLQEAGGTFQKNEATGQVTWASIAGTAAEGELLQLTFRVLEQTDGVETKVSVSQKGNSANNFVDTEIQPIQLEVKDGVITVLSGEKTEGTAGQNGNQAGQTAAELPFADVKQEDWFFNSVAYVYQAGLMNGIGAAAFAPGSSLTRAMVVQVLYNMEGKPACGKNTFEDVTDTDWYCSAVTWGAEQKIVNGYGNGSFGPLDPVTREQFATILFRYTAGKQQTADFSEAHLAAFADGGEVSDYAVAAMNWAVSCGILTGRTENLLDPRGTANRAEAAAMLTRLMENNRQTTE